MTPALWALLLLFELVILYLSQRRIYGMLAQRGLSYRQRIWVLMPSTVFHELAHWTMAVILFVPRARTRLFAPEQKPDGSVVLGYVETYYTDPVRHALVALAPVFLLPPAVAAAAWYALQIGTIWAVLLALVFILPAASAAFPSPGDKPGWAGWTALTMLAAAGMYLTWPQPLEWAMPLAYIYGPAALISALILFLLRPAD